MKMIRNNILLRIVTSLWVMLMFGMLFTECRAAPSAAMKILVSGETWEVGRTIQLDKLVISEGADIVAPHGYDLTMTVDGVGTTIAPGTYEGNVVLTPTQEYLVKYGQYDPYHFRAAVIVKNGKIVKEQSIAAAAGNAIVGDAVATNVTVVSREEKFNGIVVTGESIYTVNNATIDMTGNGGNDFAGFGAAIMSSGSAVLTVNKADIKTRGAVRTALFVGGKSTMFVNDSNIEVFSGVLPRDYEFSIVPGKMMEVPYGLGISGNIRATNLIDEATVYYTGCHIKSHGWGALSSDGNGPTRMFVKDCLIETEGSGYGAYANGDAHDYISGSTFNVADVGVIVGGNGWVTFTDGTVINSRKLGVMMHQGTGGSLLTVEKKSIINSKNTSVQIKGRGADVIIDDSTLNPENGILIQTMRNDDPIMAAMATGGGPGSGMPGGPLPDGALPGGDVPGGPGGSPGGGGMPGSESNGHNPDINVLFRHANLRGDVLHAMTEQGNMTVALQDATLTGAISSATTVPASGKAPTRETFSTVGEVTNTLGPSTGEYGIKVFLDWDSKWVVDKTSYINGLVIANGATLIAPEGGTLKMSVNNVNKPISAGVYAGKIIIRLVPGM